MRIWIQNTETVWHLSKLFQEPLKEMLRIYMFEMVKKLNFRVQMHFLQSEKKLLTNLFRETL